MSVLLKDNIHLLHVLKSGNPAIRNFMLKNSSNSFTKCLCEICLNILKGSIPLSAVQKKHLKRYRSTLHLLANKKQSLLRKKREIIQKGGILPLILTPILSIAAELLEKFISK